MAMLGFVPTSYATANHQTYVVLVASLLGTSIQEALLA